MPPVAQNNFLHDAPKGRLVSWALYDLANTIFSAVFLTAYFPLMITEMTGVRWAYGAACTAAMIIAGLLVPFLGALSDHTGKTKQYLFRTTLITIAFMLAAAVLKRPRDLILVFVCGCIFYHASLVFYHTLLPTAAPPGKQGFTSGLGTGLGYLGVVMVLPLTHWAEKHWGTSSVFLFSGFLFFIFSLPLFFRVPERSVPHPQTFRWSFWKEAWLQVFKLIAELKSRPVLLLFLSAHFLTVDALNSLIFWFMVYAREVFHPEKNVLILLLAGVNVAGFLMGLLSGALTDRWGALPVTCLSALMLTATLTALHLLPAFRLFAVFSMTGGAFAIAGTWTAGRKALIELAGDGADLGEYFGLYVLTAKLSVFSTLFFGILADSAGFREALGILLFPATAGLVLFLCAWGLKRKYGQA